MFAIFSAKATTGPTPHLPEDQRLAAVAQAFTFATATADGSLRAFALIELAPTSRQTYWPGRSPRSVTWRTITGARSR